MIRSFILFMVLIFFPRVFAADGVEVYADCSNYCAFNEFENNCHGIAFKHTKENKVDYLYSHWGKNLTQKNGCIYNRIPHYHFIDAEKISLLCPCLNTPPNPELPEKYQPMSDRTRKELIVLRSKLKKYAACAPDPLLMPVPEDVQHPYKPQDVESCEKMKAKGKPFYMVLGDCAENGRNCSYHGNTNNYSGPLCFAGESDRCQDVSLSQNPETGAWYRNAFQRRFTTSGWGQPLFSRDEFLGVMLYLAKTKDKVAAERWLRFIDKNPKKKITLVGIPVHNICPPLPEEKPIEIPDEDWQKMQPDDRCEMRGDSWAAMYRTYLHIGFTKDELFKISPSIYLIMNLFSGTAGISSNLSSRVIFPYGYELGNQASNILLLNAIGMKKDKLLINAAKVIDRRTDYESAYYHYLAEGEKATEYGAALIKKYCPKVKPDYTHPPQGGTATAAASYFDFGVHYFMGVKDGWEANLPTGHECIGWINLYLKN